MLSILLIFAIVSSEPKTAEEMVDELARKFNAKVQIKLESATGWHARAILKNKVWVSNNRNIVTVDNCVDREEMFSELLPIMKLGTK